MSIKFNESSNIIDLDELTRLLPEIPLEVTTQFLSDHGRNSDFQAQYSELDLSLIEWRLASVVASTIATCDYYPKFGKWVNMVQDRTNQYSARGWECIDTRADVVKHWRQYKTWKIPPVFLSIRTSHNVNKLQLLEGHTRIGILKGVINLKLIEPLSEHNIWLGTLK